MLYIWLSIIIYTKPVRSEDCSAIKKGRRGRMRNMTKIKKYAVSDGAKSAESNFLTDPWPRN